MEPIRVSAYAKLNLSLDVLSRRDDGFHELRMVMQSVALHDDLLILLNRTGHFGAQTNRRYLPCDANNIAVRAAELFLRETGHAGMGAFVRLRKRIPVCAGLGGGSSDAAAVLRALNTSLRTGLTAAELEALGGRLGSDVPYCIAGGTVLAEGRGERLTPLSALPATDVVICKPDFPISTPALFSRVDSRGSRCHPDTDGILRALETGDRDRVARRMYNVFEDVLGRRAGAIAAIKSALLDHGALGAVMSGTGSAVFGLFPDRSGAERACLALRGTYRECFCTETIGRLAV